MGLEMRAVLGTLLCVVAAVAVPLASVSRDLHLGAVVDLDAFPQVAAAVDEDSLKETVTKKAPSPAPNAKKVDATKAKDKAAPAKKDDAAKKAAEGKKTDKAAPAKKDDAAIKAAEGKKVNKAAPAKKGDAAKKAADGKKVDKAAPAKKPVKTAPAKKPAK